MINRKYFLFISVCTFLLCMLACSKTERRIDISGIELSVNTFRFDEFLAKGISEEKINQFQTEYPEFSTAFNKAILRSEGSYTQGLKQFQSYFDSIGVNQKINEQYNRIAQTEQRFTDVQKRLKAIFPDYEAVHFITMNSGFNYKNFLLDEQIAVGLDMYLGDAIEYEKIGSQFPLYKIHTFTKDYLVNDLAESLIRDIYPDNPENNTLLSKIIYEGKVLWLKQLALPDAEEHQIIKFTEEDWQWCTENERDIWRYFVSEELLYSRDFHRFKTYVNEGPFSSGMPKDSPANTGSFTGWQIMQQFARNNKDKSVSEIIATDAQTILSEADYKP